MGGLWQGRFAQTHEADPDTGAASAPVRRGVGEKRLARPRVEKALVPMTTTMTANWRLPRAQLSKDLRSCGLCGGLVSRRPCLQPFAGKRQGWASCPPNQEGAK